MNPALRIDVAFDFICPWCLIGKRQLEQAVTQLQQTLPLQEVSTDWQGVQLLPDLPAGGQAFGEFYLRRLGSEAAVQQRQRQVQEAAEAVGLRIRFERISRMPNTADAHRLFRQAAVLGSPQQRELLLERLFAAHFNNGEDLGNSNTLLAIAEACGYSREAMTRALYGDGRPYQAADVNASSVPEFVFDKQLRLSGAQPAEYLLRAMQQVLGTAQQRSERP
ncbi:putative DsbA family dithiol-disulfide isomerase [Pseudomonas sp. TE3786]